MPALPAIIQNKLERNPEKEPLANGIMAPPSRIDAKKMDELSLWHAQYGAMFEIGTLYTMVAGLLNIVVIFDAYGGPVILNYQVSGSRGPPGKSDE